jgi:putative Holliday junction resolvase
MPEAPSATLPSGPAAAARLVLAFDFGRRRIGVACGDTLSRTASPITTVRVGRESLPWDAITDLMKDWQPALAIVGLPYNVDGSENELAVAARAFAGEIARRYGLPVDLVDERYSSLEASARLREARALGVRTRRVAKADVDAAAAGVILERWFLTTT